MSRPDRTFPTLNAVRGIGALMVLTTHAAFNTGQILRGWPGGVLARLDFGVPLFFVLSGFLLSRPFFLAIGRGERHPSHRHYLWKRALRILPLYWVVVCVALLFDPANEGLGWEVWVRQLTLTQLYFPTLLPQSLTQMWSLCTEVAFYVLMPLTAYFLAATRRRTGLHLPTILGRSLVIAALGVAWQAWFAHIPGREGHYLQWLPGWMPMFLVGMCFAAVSADLTLRPRDHLLDRMGKDLAGCWILAGAVFAIACTPVAGPRTLAMPLGWEAATKVVLYTLAAGFFVLPLMFGPELEGRVRHHLSGTGRVLARRRVVRRVRDPPVHHGRAVPGARHRAVHRPLLHDPDPGRGAHPGGRHALVALLREPDPEVQERALDGAPRAGRDPGRSRLPGTSTGARSAALTAASASIAQAWAQ